MVFWGSGEIRVLSTPTQRRLRVWTSFPKGAGCTSSPLPVAYRGNPRTSNRGNPWTGRAAASSSSITFLEVLLGTPRFGVLGAWWKFSEGRSSGESSPFSSIRHCRCFFFSFSFVFLLGLPCAVCPSSDLALYRLVSILI